MGDLEFAKSLSARRAINGLYGRLTALLRRANLWATPNGTPRVTDPDLVDWLQGCANLFKVRRALKRQIHEAHDPE